MKRHLILVITALLFSAFSFSQTVLWSEDFGTPASGTLANGFNNGNGAWTVTPTGANGADANEWYVSGEECGNASGACGSVCAGGDASLHISSSGTLFGDVGAAYAAGGGGFFFVDTDKRVESPVIDLTGQTGMTLTFTYIEDYVGQGGYDPGDDATLWYFDGAIWAQIDALAITAAGCNPQGTWTTYSAAMPASADNNANVQIGFHWFNNDDNIGTDPSIAIDDIQITIPTVGGPTADFTASSTSICVGDCIDFTDNSVLGANPNWAWTFAGADAPGTSAVQNPTNICYNTAGTYQVELTVTDDDGTDTETKVGYITVSAAGNAGGDVTTNVCQQVDNTNNFLNVGALGGGTWVETSGTPTGNFVAATGDVDFSALPLGNVYTFTYTSGTAPCDDMMTLTLTVTDCSVPTSSFTPSATTICPGDCITFNDNSTGALTTWDWVFNGANTATSNLQDPGAICWATPGTYDVDLTVGDGTNTNTSTVSITVNAPPNVTATASPSETICAGDQVTLTGGGAVSYAWDNGVVDGVAFTPAMTTTYTVTGTDANMCTRDFPITITVENCAPVAADFNLPANNLCVGECITINDLSTGSIVDWNWDFGGGGTPNTSTDQNPTVCFTAPGTFNIQLTVTDALGESASSTQSVSVFTSPSVLATLDTVIDLGGTANLIANGSTLGSYAWSPNDNVACDTCAITSADPWVTTAYVVTLTDVNGCAAQDTVDIYVNFIEGIGVPSAFSPNADGNNDVLYVKGVGITALNFTIYNRYGQKVFETLDQNIGWDGTYLGKDENSGVFTWVLEYNMVNNSAGILKGNTTLIR